jgi:hypothetical protein
VLNCQGLDGRFPLRAADGSMTTDRLLTVPESEEGDSGSRARLPLHPTCALPGVQLLAWLADWTGACWVRERLPTATSV